MTLRFLPFLSTPRRLDAATAEALKAASEADRKAWARERERLAKLTPEQIKAEAARRNAASRAKRGRSAPARTSPKPAPTSAARPARASVPAKAAGPDLSGLADRVFTARNQPRKLSPGGLVVDCGVRDGAEGVFDRRAGLDGAA